jgi:hypothetical protein
MEQMRSPPPHLASVAKSLRRDLKAITSDFKLAMQERAGTVEATLTHGERTISAFGARTLSFQDQVLIEQNRNRLDTVRNVDTSVHEIPKLFAELSAIIVRDDYANQRIDEQTEAALTSLEEGQRELVKYYEKVKGTKFFPCDSVSCASCRGSGFHPYYLSWHEN